MASDNLRTRLRSETHETHVELERALNLLDPDLTLIDYRQLLQRFYGYYAPLEIALQQLPAIPAWRELMADRWKTSALVDDLRYLQLKSSELKQVPTAKDLPKLTKHADAMGALYVVEGSTLGGAVLSRHFAERFQLARDRGLAFFNIYGEHTGEMWQRYLAALEEYDNNEEYDNDQGSERVIAAAKATFSSLAEWLTRSEASSTTLATAGAATR